MRDYKKLVSTLNDCERNHLGRNGVERHQELEDLIDQGFDASHSQISNKTNIKNELLWNSAIGKMIELMEELIELRDAHGLSNDGDCYKCDFNKDCYRK